MTRCDLRDSYGDRLRLAACVGGLIIAIGLLLRIVLYCAFHDASFHLGQLALVLVGGVVFDALTTAVALWPAWLGLAWLRLRVLGNRHLRFAFLWLFGGGMLFLAAVEFFFFEEFNARFNHIALDYILYPTEVFGNIWQSYNVPLFLAVAAGAGILAALPQTRWLRDASFGPLPFSARWRAGLIALVVPGAALLTLTFLPATVSSNRITSEIAQNGMSQLVRAFLTAHLDYHLYYPTLPDAEAKSRAARFLGFPPPEGAFLPRRRLIPAAAAAPRNWDVVIIIEESFGSEFIGALGHGDRNTSREFDRWSRDGLLLTNLIATGNRTVRGLEGVLCSFVPLPGDSVVKRDRSENVASLARVFKGLGYRTSFFYGGWGIFDNMKPFMRANGYDDFIERPAYPSDAFHTIWGVADEYVFDSVIERQKQAAQKGERFFGTVMSVSNHKPFAVPHRVMDRPAGEKTRDGAVADSDWAIGHYLDQAKSAGLLDHTLVMIVADHGARVYGAQEIPAASYRIPAMFVVPDPAWRGGKIQRLCSQVDLAPTLLSLAGVECEAPFMGQDLTAAPADGGRAFLQHNRDIGVLTDDLLVVLGLRKTATFYRRPGRESDEFALVPPDQVTGQMLSLQKDATAVFQMAYETYQNRQYRLPESNHDHP